MVQMRSIKAVTALASVLVVSGLAAAGGEGGSTYEEKVFDLTGVAYIGGVPEIVADLEIGPAQVSALRWENVILQTFDNTGIPNWGSEAFFGFQAVTAEGSSEIVMVQPFPDANSGGTFGPTDGSLEVELSNLFSSPEGRVSLLTASSWDDGSGEAAGEYIQGSLVIVYEPILIPAPGVLAVLGLAGISGRRRRRG